MKIRPRCTRNRAVASLAEPMLLLSTVNVYKPSQRSKIQRRIEGISYLSTGRCYVQVDAICYDLSLCFWTDTNERYPSFSAICRVPKTWSPRMFLSAINQCIERDKQIILSMVENPLEANKRIVTVNDIAILYVLISSKKALDIALCRGSYCVSGGSQMIS